MIGYKATDKDGTCRGFKFEVGKTYRKNTKKEELKCCTDKVFHFCRDLHSVWNYYSKNSSRLFEVVAGDYVKDGDKYGTNEITILREIKGDELKELLNSGHCNSGDCNSGNWNSGDCNSGHWNSGDWNSGNRNSRHCNSGHWNSGNWNSGNRNSGHCNSGDWNSGDWNSGDCNSGDCNSGDWNSGNWNSGFFNSGNWNSGFFNSDEPYVRMFNRGTNLKREEINIPDWCYFDLTEWKSVDTATEEEQKQYAEEIKTCGGFLKTLKYEEAWNLAYNKTNDEDKKQLFDLPNFDCKVFEEISGIDTKVDYVRIMGVKE